LLDSSAITALGALSSWTLIHDSPIGTPMHQL
jgi:hypothetical protein